jgi:hypothetical protein
MMARRVVKIGVSVKALVARINRKLKPDDEKLHRSRSPRMVIDVGEYYVVRWPVGGVVLDHLDLEDYARELGVLQPYEELREE